MKWPFFCPLALVCLFLAGCESFNQPLNGEYDPLSSPGSRNTIDTATVNAEVFKPGQYVTAATNSTAFFSKRPTGNAEAELLLAAGTSMRVVKTEGSFVKVELDKDGKVGYVNSAMLTDGRAGQYPPSGAVQVYPPIGGGYDHVLPLPPAAGTPPTDLTTGAPLPPISPPSVPEVSKNPATAAPVPLPGTAPEVPAPGTPVQPAPSTETEKPKESVELPEPADSKPKDP